MGRVQSWLRSAVGILANAVDWRPEPVDPLSGRALEHDIASRRDAARPGVEAARESHRQEALTLGFQDDDPDEHTFRRISTGRAAVKRDLSPLHQDRMIQIAWYLFEGNPFAQRLIKFMTDLVVGEGISITAKDERVQEIIQDTFTHRVNQLWARIREFYYALSLNGELIITVAVNPVTGRPTYGFIDPHQVAKVLTLPDNVLVPDILVLKVRHGASGAGSIMEGQRLQIIRENAAGVLEGEVFYFPINKLPNSTRGRSDLMPLADWLDVYDQYMFAEVERLNLLSAFVWDYQVDEAGPTEIAAKKKEFPRPKPGSVWVHNEKEHLEAVTPELNATDRSEVAKLLRTHIAGSFGFPLSYMGETSSNRATIDGQNDVMMKTPKARQREFKGFLAMVTTHAIQQHLLANPSLFRDADPSFDVIMPEIAAKDIARVGGVLAAVASAIDTSIGSKTMSKRSGIVIMAAVISHLGVELDPTELQAQIDEEGDDDSSDLLQQALAQVAAMKSGNPPPAVPDDEREPAAAA